MTPQIALRLHSLCRSVRMPPPRSVARVYRDARAPVPASDAELWTFTKSAYPMPDFDAIVRGCADHVVDALRVAPDERDKARELAALIVGDAFADWWNAFQREQFGLLRALHPRPDRQGARDD